MLQEPIKPHEVKVLNFLVHEYLLQRGNTMTAITLCEENSDQACGVGWGSLGRGWGSLGWGWGSLGWGWGSLG